MDADIFAARPFSARDLFEISPCTSESAVCDLEKGHQLRAKNDCHRIYGDERDQNLEWWVLASDTSSHCARHVHRVNHQWCECAGHQDWIRKEVSLGCGLLAVRMVQMPLAASTLGSNLRWGMGLPKLEGLCDACRLKGSALLTAQILEAGSGRLGMPCREMR